MLGGDKLILAELRAVTDAGVATAYTTNTLDLKVRGIYQDGLNILGQYAKVFVTFNNLVESDQKAGI